MAPMLMDVQDVADALRLSPHTVRRLATRKKLRRVKVGSRTMFDPRDVANFVEKAKQASSEEQAEEAG